MGKPLDQIKVYSFRFPSASTESELKFDGALEPYYLVRVRCASQQIWRRMSALGLEQTFPGQAPISALLLQRRH
jgi:hypothetical protein